MCIIIAKPAGVDLPTKNQLKNSFLSNSDGAGVMFFRNGKVHIDKGYMYWKDYRKILKKWKLGKDDNIVYHMRIATQGGVSPNNCHPFPISAKVEELKRTFVTSDAGFAHNGIFALNDIQEDLSDSQIFVKDILSEVYPECVTNNGYKLLYDMSIEGSKTAILDKNGITMAGNGWIKQDGLFFSNSGFKNTWGTNSYHEDIDKVWGYNNPTWEHNDNFWEEDENFCTLCLHTIEDHWYFCPFCGESTIKTENMHKEEK